MTVPTTPVMTCVGAAAATFVITTALAVRGRWRSPVAPLSFDASVQTDVYVPPTSRPVTSQAAGSDDALSPVPPGWTQGWLS